MLAPMPTAAQVFCPTFPKHRGAIAARLERGPRFTQRPLRLAVPLAVPLAEVHGTNQKHLCTWNFLPRFSLHFRCQ